MSFKGRRVLSDEAGRATGKVRQQEFDDHLRYPHSMHYL